MFWSKLFGQKTCTTTTISLENTAIYSVLEQVVLNHCYYMGRKHCNLQCFGESCLAKAFKIATISLENIVIYSVLEKVVWQRLLKLLQYR